jgi:acetyl esterase/lipase
MPEYQIPEIRKDIERAVRYVRFHAREWKVDPNRLGIVGHSSGGHLALLHSATAKDESSDAQDPVDRMSSKVQAVACFYPPTDFLFFGAKGINALANQKFEKYLPAFVTDLKDSSALARIAGEVSPIRYVSPAMPPTCIISGNADRLVPFQQSLLFIEKLKELNVPCCLLIREGKGHGWPEIAEEYIVVAGWFEQWLK